MLKVTVVIHLYHSLYDRSGLHSLAVGSSPYSSVF